METLLSFDLNSVRGSHDDGSGDLIRVYLCCHWWLKRARWTFWYYTPIQVGLMYHSTTSYISWCEKWKCNYDISRNSNSTINKIFHILYCACSYSYIVAIVVNIESKFLLVIIASVMFPLYFYSVCAPRGIRPPWNLWGIFTKCYKAR